MDRMLRYDWPGNVRELQHTIERAVLLAEGEVLTIERPAESPSGAGQAGGPVAAPGETARELISLDDMERQYIQEVLRHTGGQIAGKGGAAEILGLQPSTLRSRMMKLGLK
jgi:DNA-binding NtrC family response regulator